MGAERKIRWCKGWRSLAVICLAVILLAGAAAENVQAATYSFKSTTIYADGTRTAKFTCNGMTGLCCKAGAYSTYSGTASLSRLKNTSNAAYCAYYYGYCKGWTSGSNAHKLARLLSYCMGNGTGGDYKASTMKSLLKTAKKQSVPSGFECWLCKPKGSSKQDFIVWKYPRGKLKVVKKSADTSISGKGTYTLAGITIRVYSDAACKTCVKTLTTKKDGTTGGAFSLPVGTYYVKETKVPESTGFLLNSKVQKVSVSSGKTASVTVTNKPDTGKLTVRKHTAGEGGSVQGFRFRLIGMTSGKQYTLTTGADGTAAIAGLPFGRYRLAEELTAEQQKYYTDRTGPQTITIAKGSKTQNITVQRENSYEAEQRLKILKRTEDGGDVSGFSFLVSWLLDNSEKISAEDIVIGADPQVELGEQQTLGLWQLEDAEVIDRINEAAAAGETGVFEVVLKNTVTTRPGETEEPAQSEEPAQGEEPAQREEPEGPEEGAGPEAGSSEAFPGTVVAAGTGDEETISRPIRCSVAVELTAAGSAAKEEAGGDRLPSRVQQVSSQEGDSSVRFWNLRFAGAADRGEETVQTDESGQYVMNHVAPGEYTVAEQMSDRQKQRYRQPQVQKKTVPAGGDEMIVFSFINEPILIPVRLQKESADGQIENIEFTLTGTPDYLQEPMEERIVPTDENGIADFGSLYPGTYHIAESGFDGTGYSNAYPEEEGDVPGFSFTITGEELTPEEIESGESLWLGGDPGKGTVSREKIPFRNIPYVDLLLTKVDGITGSFLPGAEFLLEDSAGALAARFRIDEGENGEPEVIMQETDGIVTGEYSGETAEEEGASPVIIGGAAAAEDPEEDKKQPAYACARLRGLKEGEIYTLTETKAPEGFTPLTEPCRFAVALTESGETELRTCDEYGERIAGDEAGGMLVIVNDGPSIGTVCLDDATGEHTAKASGQVQLTDTCTVTNLTEGETYTLIAHLMDTTEYKVSGNVDDVVPVMGKDGPVTGQITFRAEAGQTAVGVPIRAEGVDLSGRSTVVYESLYQGETELSEVSRKSAAAEEADPDNENQAVMFEAIGTEGSPETGSRFPAQAMAAAAIAALAAMLAACGRRMYRRR
ncbi:MAG: VaFE repeat-containing surface-anchored protein [Firmicutes bacterium]|nr:VaFE repeat-containing surface-anchored protein [Bacillota bacterium]